MCRDEISLVEVEISRPFLIKELKIAGFKRKAYFYWWILIAAPKFDLILDNDKS